MPNVVTAKVPLLSMCIIHVIRYPLLKHMSVHFTKYRVPLSLHIELKCKQFATASANYLKVLNSSYNHEIILQIMDLLQMNQAGYIFFDAECK